MISRRAVLKGAAAVPLLGVGVSALASGTGVTGAVQAMVYDSRFVASRPLATELMRMGVQGAAFDGDVTDLWFRTLDPLWSQRPATVAGFTSPTALLCLEQLAWNRHHRLVMRIDHISDLNGGVEHRIYAPAELLPAMSAALRQAPEWSRTVARLAGELPGSLFYTARMEQERVHIPRSAVSMGALAHQVSWVLAADKNMRSV